MDMVVIDGVKCRKIPGFARYLVSEAGGVYSTFERGSHKECSPHPLKLARRRNGYLFLTMSNDEKKITSVSVHRCVLLAFIGEPAENQEACHNNGIRDDNRLDNLRWDTRKRNHADKWKHGTQQAGSQGSTAKLTELQVEDIKKRLSQGERCSHLGAEYGVDYTTIAAIKSGKNWPHVAPELNKLFVKHTTSRRVPGIQIKKVARECGISTAGLHRRLRMGETLEQAIEHIQKWKRKCKASA